MPYLILSSILFLLLLLPNLMVAAVAVELEGQTMMKVVYIAVSVSLLFVPAVVLKKKAYFLFEGVFTLLLAPVEIASLVLSHTYTHMAMADVILSTNLHEALELLGSLWPVAMAFVALVVAYFYVVIRYVENEPFFNRKVRRLFLSALPVLFVGGFSYYFVLARNMLTSSNTTVSDNLIDTKDLIVEKFNRVFPFSVYSSVAEVFDYRAEVELRQQKLSSFSFGIEADDAVSDQTVVLVIGETARWRNFGVNGYPRNTTPGLAKMPNLVSYNHAVTQANLTSHSVPLILTRADAVNRNLADEEKTISEAFAEAGFETSWISNQSVTKFQKRVIDGCDNRFITTQMINCQSEYDLGLLPPFRQFLASQARKKFIVIHTMGSHFRYDKRYPHDSTFFRPSFDNSMDMISVNRENAECVINAYDNSIRFTDAFLCGVVDELQRQGGLWTMLYLSDHGENLFDDERDLILHGSLVVSEYEAHIPLLVAYSGEYEKSNPQKVQNIIANKDANLTSAVVFHSLLDMAGIQSPLLADSLCITRANLPLLTETRILNANKQLIDFQFSKLDK